MNQTTLYFGEIWHVPDQPPAVGRAAEFLQALPRGGLAVDGAGKILSIGEAATVRAAHPGAAEVDFGSGLILPGFVDAHVHFPQLDMIGAYGEQLLGWLEAYTYPQEQRFADPAHAAGAAGRFVTELLANGTTLAAVYTSVHEHAAAALLAECDRRGLRAIVGKASMDRAAPAALCQNAADDRRANERLIADWHGRHGRLFVALTPRFAVSCSPELLRSLGELKRQAPDVYVQSHHAETTAEVAEVHRLFPEAASYLDVYDRFGLLGERTVMGHAIHATGAEIDLYRERHAAVAHCPTSNLFLGSGLFPLRRFADAGVKVALGSDVGAGTSFSLLRTMGEAYKVQHLRGESVSPVRLLWHATLGGAEALGLGKVTGSFTAGKQADFQVLDPARSRLLAERFQAGDSAFDRLGALCQLADDRLTRAVYVDGRLVFS